MEDLLEDMQRELQLNTPWKVVSYDTTFQLGNFYLSFVIYRLTNFKGEPCIPALFLLHESKFVRTHRTFFKHLKEVIPGNCRVSIVTDRERVITTAITAEVPSLPQVFCWNHIFRDVRNWLVKCGATHREIPIITSQLQTPFCQPSQQEARWIERGMERPIQGVLLLAHPQGGRHGDWKVEAGEFGVVPWWLGYHYNMSESLNRVVKALQNWKEAPVDAMVTALYQLQQYFYQMKYKEDWLVSRPTGQLQWNGDRCNNYLCACTIKVLVSTISSQSTCISGKIYRTWSWYKPSALMNCCS